MRLWDAETGEPLSPPLPAPPWYGPPAEFTPDGRRLVGHGAGGVEVWDLTPDHRPLSNLQEFSGILAGHRLDPTGTAVPEDPAAVLSAWEGWRAHHPDGEPTMDRSGWHRQRADDAMSRRQWFAADWHLTRLIESGRADASAWADRGTVRDGLGNLPGAAADYERAGELEPERWQTWSALGNIRGRLSDPPAAARAYARAVGLGADDPWAWYRLALLQANAGDVESYRKTCAGALDRFVASGDEDPIDAMAMACAVREGALPDLGGLIAALRAAGGGKNFRYLNWVGTLLLRAGDAAGAVEVLDDARVGLGRGESPWVWLPLALAHARLGHNEEARRWMTKAAEWLDGPEGRNLSWPDRMHLELLRREATERIRGK
jgi:tetratricopeptide (TPR) repeat protein